MTASPPSQSSRQHGFEETLTRVGMLAGAVAGTVGFVYVIGGAVMWLRFWRSDLPADQALALVPRTDLIVVGMRVLIIPALAAGGLFVLLAKRSNGRPRRRTVALLAFPGVVLMLVVPLSFGSYAWPLAALALAYVWARVLPNGERGRLAWHAAVAAVLVAATVSLARQLDHPVKLPSATLTFGAEEQQVTGVLVTANPDAVVLGFPGERELRSFPRQRVTAVDIGPALDRRSPPQSLLSRVLGGDAWAATPLELWCGGESYGWGRVGDLCRSQPYIVDRRVEPEDGKIAVRVMCPEHAQRACTGFFTLTTVDDFEVDDNARKAPLRLGRTVFQVQRESWVRVAVDIDDVERRCLLSAGQPVPTRVVLSSDQAGEGVLNDGGQLLLVDFDAPDDPPTCAPKRENRSHDGENGTGADDDENGTDDEDTGGDTSGGDGDDTEDDTEDEETAGDDDEPPAGDEPSQDESLPAVPPDPGDEVVTDEDGLTAAE
jgi:hypothetical protein